MNSTKKINLHILTLLSFFFLSAFAGCEDNTLKRPEPGNPGSQPKETARTMGEADREYIRELAREFAQELRKEIGSSVGDVKADQPSKEKTFTEFSGLLDESGNPHPLLAHCSDAVLDFYLKHKEAFQISSINQLPKDLRWEDGSKENEFSSPDAKRGGTWKTFMSDFPRTLRTIGPDANGAFRRYLLDYNGVGLVMTHPNSDGYYPGLAERWALGEDGRTVYFQLDGDARYSDGQPVRASDFFFTFYFMRSKHLQAPWYNDFYGKDKFLKVTLFNKNTLSITYHSAKPDLVERISIRSIPEHFYDELGGDYLKKYQWVQEPTTGPYVVRKEDIKKGQSVTLTRLSNWWADQKKFYRNRYNPDRIMAQVIRDPSKAFEVFLKGDLDMFSLSKTDYWYEKLPDTHQLVSDGYLTKVTFFNQVPPPSYALRINSSKPPFDDLNIRIGFQHSMNFDLVLQKIFRGDFERMRTVADGYGKRSHPTLQARKFSVDLATKFFAKAGYRDRGKDGILINDAGKRLSVELLTGYKHLEDVLVVLREEAKKAGLDLKLKILESTAAFKTASEKNHQVVFSAFSSFVELFPRFWEPYHSDNAYSPSGKEKFTTDGTLRSDIVVKTSTNNFTQTAVLEIDQLIDQYRMEENLKGITSLAHQLSKLIHDHAVYVPGWKKPWLRMGHWNWVAFPEDWGPRETRDYAEFQVFWIDEDKRLLIDDARKNGRKLDAQFGVRVYEKHRINL